MPQNIKSVDIYGGTAVVSNNVVSTLNSKGITVNRISGKNRYSTNIKALKRLNLSDNAILVRGTSVKVDSEDYPDAVAASSLAHKFNAGIILSHHQQILSSVHDYLHLGKTTKVYVLGGEVAIPSSLLDAYK